MLGLKHRSTILIEITLPLRTEVEGEDLFQRPLSLVVSQVDTVVAGNQPARECFSVTDIGRVFANKLLVVLLTSGTENERDYLLSEYGGCLRPVFCCRPPGKEDGFAMTDRPQTLTPFLNVKQRMGHAQVLRLSGKVSVENEDRPCSKRANPLPS